MSSDAVIAISHIHKAYRLFRRPSDRIRQFFASNRKYYEEFWALQDVSFEVQKGETVGIVGKNGSGKSTLLQMICGVLRPTSGTIETRGRIAALLELGAGFNPEFSGRENVYLNGLLLGLTRAEIDARFESIVAFADIGHFIDQPVKTYSSGMVVRLAFAVQAQIEPDILIVDEALAVGDARFQAKCFDRLKTLKERGTSILLVTHSTEQIVAHCTRAVLLDKGRIVHIGAPKDVANRYLDILFGAQERPQLAAAQQALSQKPADADEPFASRPAYNPHEYRWGDGAAKIWDFSLSVGGRETVNIKSGERVTLEVAFRFHRAVEQPILGFNIKTKEGITVYNSNSRLLGAEPLHALGAAGTSGKVRLGFDCPLAAGDYFISLGIVSPNGADVTPHDRRYDAIHFVIEPTPHFLGLVDIHCNMTVQEESAYDSAA